jgi:hypothetical protein
MPDNELLTIDQFDDDEPIADDRDDEQMMQSVRANSDDANDSDDADNSNAEEPDESIGPNDPDKLTNAGEM